MQVDYHLAADPIDVVAAFTAQRPCHRRKRTRVSLLTVVFVSANVAILAKSTSHIAGGEEDRARTFRAAVKQLLAGVMEMRADPRGGSELAGAELRASRTIDTAIPRAKITVGEHPINKLAAQLKEARPVRCRGQWRARPDRLPALKKYRCYAVELGPERLLLLGAGSSWIGRVAAIPNLAGLRFSATARYHDRLSRIAGSSQILNRAKSLMAAAPGR